MKLHNLNINDQLHAFVEQQLIAKTSLNSDEFWQGLSAIIDELTPENKALLARRDDIQNQIDTWHLANPDASFATYKAFLQEIGYLLEEPEAFTIDVADVEPEISTIAGPQLVVPVDNARYALNALNARWGSLFDAIYGSDIVDAPAAGTAFNDARGSKVFAFAHQFLDQVAPLNSASYNDLSEMTVIDGQLKAKNGSDAYFTLMDERQFVGYQQVGDTLKILLKNNNLHIAIHVNPNGFIGAKHPAGIEDVVLESAISTIMDLEDSVATVFVEDKITAYGNLIGLMDGSLSVDMEKNGKTMTRKLNAPHTYTSPEGKDFQMSAQSLMLIRNVGIHMFCDHITDAHGNDIPEGILDAAITALIAKYAVDALGKKSVYVVKPKQHGPEEVAFSVKVFAAVEALCGLPSETLKMGIMDEERRTTVNLRACIKAAQKRVVFINTGFLDRTGDEIHTSMQAGPFLPKDACKQQAWLGAYENANVAAGLSCGFLGQAQIGKGMWAIPDNMKAMLETKVGHVLAGASCAWVPSPTAATIHVMHYHLHNVADIQKNLSVTSNVDEILEIPLMKMPHDLTDEQIQAELDNNIQGILGYVVHWINAGIGCSKVKDIHDVGLMEDRATLRISSQHVANWLLHGICSEQQVNDTFAKMAEVVNQQNAGQTNYEKLVNDPSCIAYAGAKALVFEGVQTANGYTEPVLNRFRAQHGL